ncbi:hypothetical protein HN832_04280 [archaeon]|jgi:hypothetical protein|nr:hypothetical protein [archaeon]MBT4373388.1 hypothetical protein [archaeon]MBT4531836.1 hypothetical protein [archaeon]MBT7001503.1 hypothetical protein [archaeon]MBT7282605.1 hypothetical protein [archaeon]
MKKRENKLRELIIPNKKVNLFTIGDERFDSEGRIDFGIIEGDYCFYPEYWIIEKLKKKNFTRGYYFISNDQIPRRLVKREIRFGLNGNFEFDEKNLVILPSLTLDRTYLGMHPKYQEIAVPCLKKVHHFRESRLFGS